MPDDDNSEPPAKERRVRKYPESYNGPVIVIVESVTGSNLACAKIAKYMIKKFGDDYVRAMPISKTKLKVLFQTKEAANNLVEKQIADLRFVIPQRLVECLGVAYIETDVQDDELITARAYEKGKLIQQHNPEIVECRRIVKKQDEKDIPLYTVIFTFSGSILPSHVELNKVLYSVKQYVYPVRQCGKCWRLGHNKTQCKSQPRCYNCLNGTGNPDHNCISEAPQCVNCNGAHRANDFKACPKIQLKKQKDQQRRDTFSQGKTDWFCQSGSENANQPQEIPLSSTNQQEGPRAKRRYAADNDVNDELPQLEVNISNGVCESIQSTIESDETLSIIADVFGISGDDAEMIEKINEEILVKISDTVTNRMRSYISSLRL